MVAAIVVSGPLVLYSWRLKRKAGATHVVCIGVAGGEAEMAIWSDALRNAGVKPHIRGVGDTTTGDFTASGPANRFGYQYEIWVRERDAERAREVLGL